MSYKSTQKRKSKCKSKSHQNWSRVKGLKKDLSLRDLKKDIKRQGISFSKEVVYVYVVSSTEVRNNQILQRGTGPNIEGGLITLTNCKNKMRCEMRKDLINGINLNGKMWKIDKNSIWIAGLTTRDKKKNPYNRHFLFYLMRVGKYLDSFMDLWNYLQSNYPNTLQVKMTNVNNLNSNLLGDIYEPKPDCSDPFDPNCYYPPHRNHPHHRCMNYQNQPGCHVNCRVSGCWIKDITYSKSGIHPYLLIGDKNLSYVWQIPRIQLDLNCLAQLIDQNKAVNRGFTISRSQNYVILKLNDFLNCLI